MKTALTIATSDSGGGAGIQADIKAMQAHGVYATSVLVATTAQNTQAVTDVATLPLDHIEAQIDAIVDDIAVEAVKTGMLFSSGIIETVASCIEAYRLTPLVVDPVMVAKSGDRLLQEEAIDTLIEKLLPLATVVTPNAHEASALTGLEIDSAEDAAEAARRIHGFGPENVLVKGGHLSDEAEAVDVLFDGEALHTFRAERIDTPHTHGTGCTYASSIAAGLAKGFALPEAVERAKRYLTEAIRHGWALGSGYGPTHHFYHLEACDVFPAEKSDA